MKVMKKYLHILLALTVAYTATAQSAKLVSDVTVVYDVAISDSKADPQMVKALSGATKSLYIKGSKSRSELVSSNFQQTVIHDSKTDSTIILRELGNAKYISYPTINKRTEAYKKYEGMTLVNTAETKNILGYECKKVLIKLQDGSEYNVFYTPAILPSNKDYEYQFKDLPGLVLEYESELEQGKWKVQYIATKITLSPVSSAKFDIPKTGYRVL